MLGETRQLPLLGAEPLPADGAEIRLIANYLTMQQSNHVLALLEGAPGWRQDCIRIYGKTHRLPRLHRWFADSNKTYRWSGIEMHPEPFPECVREVQKSLEKESGVHFNTALGNLYRSGSDGVSWHSDDEPELGPDPVIASLSLGATRRFLLRRRDDHAVTMSFDLTHGSLLWMSGRTQALWEHCVPKTARRVGLRINLTFRAIGE